MTDHTDSPQELKSHQIMRLWTANVPVDEIARLTGSTPGAVHVTLSKARRRGIRLKRRSERPVAVKVRPELMTAAEAEAARRGISPQELFSRIVGAVLGDRMINAVLDDMEAA